MSSIPEGTLDDVIVAAVASTCVVTLHLFLSRVAAGSGILARLAPLAVYFLYTVVHHGEVDSPLDTPRNWSLLAVGLTVVIAAFYSLA
jgi:hypothetical protein